VVSGKLDLTMGGSTQRTRDPEDPISHRRSIYRSRVRSQLQLFLTVLGCAAPSMRVDKCNVFISPLQALAREPSTRPSKTPAASF